MNSKFFKYAGIAAGVLLLAFGIGMIGVGSSARSTVNDNLAQEHITGTPDMTPALIAAAVKESKLDGIHHPHVLGGEQGRSMTAPAPSASRATCASTRSRRPAAGPSPRWASTYRGRQGDQRQDRGRHRSQDRAAHPQRGAQRVGHRDRAGHGAEHLVLRIERRPLRDRRRHRPAPDRRWSARSHGPLDPRAEAGRVDAAEDRGPDRAGTGMKALVYHGPGQRAGTPFPIRHHRPHRRHRADRHLHDLRQRSAHPQGRRPRDHSGHRPGPRGGRHRRGRRRRRDQGRRRATACWCRASARAGAAASARRPATASASAAAAGSSAT